MTLLTSMLLLGVALGVAASIVLPESEAAEPVEWLEEPEPLSNFRLASVTGPFERHAFLGRWSVVLLGFVHCPDVCPTSLAQLSMLATEISSYEFNSGLQIVFVSIDPGRDTVSVVSGYAEYFGPAFVGVTGPENQLLDLVRQLGLGFRVSARADYSVSHSTTLSVIGPEGRLQGRFQPGFKPSAVARSLNQKIIDARSFGEEKE